MNSAGIVDNCFDGGTAILIITQKIVIVTGKLSARCLFDQPIMYKRT